MDDPRVEVDCELCGEKFEITTSEYEKAMENETPILCEICFAKVLNAQEKKEEENKPKRQFEYWSGHVTQIDFDQVGAEGYELVVVADQVGYFKREIF